MKILENALKYADFGWAVFPVWGVENGKCLCGGDHKDSENNIGKHPITKNGRNDATNDKKSIEIWWRKHPKANIGIATGIESGIIALDIDYKKDGHRYLESKFPEIQDTVQAKSGSGGDHYFFGYKKGIKSTNGVLAPGIDVKSDGGYIIVEPSDHFSGGQYKWIEDQSPFEFKMALAPDWLKTSNTKTRYIEKEDYNKGERDTALISCAGSLKRAGMKPDEILIALKTINKEKCIPPLPEDQIVKIFNSCMSYPSSDSKKKGKLAQVVDIMNFDSDLNKLFKYNLFTKDIEYANIPDFITLGEKGKVLTDNDFVEIKYYLSRQYNLEVQINTIVEATVLMSLQNTYHPIRDWIDNIKWDGIKRLDTWLIDYCGAPDNKYTMAVGRKVLCATIARIYYPGHKFDFMLILEGKQGIGKSQLVKALGENWYLDTGIVHTNKDTVDKLRGAWIVEVSELVGLTRQDVQEVKAFVSRETDRERLAYRRNTESFPRQCIFIGTHNPVGDNTYFYDESGNRRFWPVECEKADYEGVKAIRDQLFAEAKLVYENGEPLFLNNKEENDVAIIAQGDRLPDDPWTMPIKKFCANRVDVTMDMILKESLHIPLERQNRGHQIKIGQIMNKLGYTKKRKNEGDREYYYEKNEGDREYYYEKNEWSE